MVDAFHGVKQRCNRVKIACRAGGVRDLQHGLRVISKACVRGRRAERLVGADAAGIPAKFQCVRRHLLRRAVDSADLGTPRNLHHGLAVLHIVPVHAGEVQAGDIGVPANLDVRRAGIGGCALGAAGKRDDIDFAAREHRDVGVTVVFRGVRLVLIAADDGERGGNRAAVQFCARDGHALADGDLVVPCHDEQECARCRVEVHVLKGRLTVEVKAVVVELVDSAALAVVHAAIYAGQRDRAGVVLAVGEICGLRKLAAEHDRAVLCEVERVIGCREGADRACRRRAVAAAAVR